MQHFESFDADIFAVQETKMQEGQAEVILPGYHQYWNSAQKKGYSGTAVFARKEPLNVTVGDDNEGRILTLEYEDFFFVNVYTPNSQRELARLAFRMEWEDAFRAYLHSLDAKKPVILCGDLNVAHQEIDIKNPKSNRRNAGFTDEERTKMTELLACGFCDTFRTLYPDMRDAYTWWSYMANARERNIGWRIDYFVVSERLMPGVTGAAIYPEVMGSDHCPVGLTL